MLAPEKKKLKYAKRIFFLSQTIEEIYIFGDQRDIFRGRKGQSLLSWV